MAVQREKTALPLPRKSRGSETEPRRGPVMDGGLDLRLWAGPPGPVVALPPQSGSRKGMFTEGLALGRGLKLPSRLSRSWGECGVGRSQFSETLPPAVS